MRRSIQTIILIALTIFLFASVCGCHEALTQPIQAGSGDQRIMIIPAGTRIGDIITDANGVYINEHFPGEVYLLPPGSVIEPVTEQEERYL